MVKVRLSRGGTKKVPFYRVVVTDSREKRDGSFIDTIGTWDPRAGEGKLVLDYAKYNAWIGKGAQASAVVATLVKNHPAPASA